MSNVRAFPKKRAAAPDAGTPAPITISELASAMQIDEDALLQRLAAILSKREDGIDFDLGASTPED